MSGRAAFGQVRKLPSGRFQARYSVPGSARGSYINAPATFPLKSAAQRWLAKQQTLIDEGKINPSAVNTTFGEFGTMWLEQRDLKASTRTLYNRQFVKALEPAWGRVRLVDITPARVGDWYATLLPDRRTERAHVYALFRTIMNTAWRQTLIESPWVRWRLGLWDFDQGLVAPLCSVELRLELDRRDVAEVAVQPLGVVPVDPAQGRQLDVLDGSPGP